MVVFGPSWFFGLDALFKGLGFIIALAITLFALQNARIVKKNRHYWFAFAFLAITGSLFLQALSGLLVYLGVLAPGVLGLSGDWFQFFLFYLSTIGFLAALLILLTIVYEAQDHRFTTLLLLTLFIAFSLVQGIHRLYLLYALSVLYLGALVYAYMKNYLKSRKVTSLLIFIAFVALLLAQFSILFRLNPLYYAVGLGFELLGYLILLGALIRMVKK